MRYYRRYRNQSSSLQAVLTGTPNASAGVLLFLRSSDEKTEPAKFFEFLSRTLIAFKFNHSLLCKNDWTAEELPYVKVFYGKN